MPKFTSAQSSPIDPPAAGQVIHEHHPTSYTGLAIVAVVTVIMAFPAAWLMIVYLFDAAGYRKPEMAAAQVILLLAIVGGVSWMIGRFLVSAVLTGLDGYYQFRLALAQEESKVLAYQAKVSAAPVQSGRASESDTLFMRRVIAVMVEAYNYHAKHGAYRGKTARPWSRAQVLEITKLTAIPTTWTEAAAVGSWLRGNGIVTADDQIAPQFETLADVQRLLMRQFDRPIQLSAGDNAGFEFIEIK